MFFECVRVAFIDEQFFVAGKHVLLADDSDESVHNRERDGRWLFCAHGVRVGLKCFDDKGFVKSEARSPKSERNQKSENQNKAVLMSTNPGFQGSSTAR